MEVVIVGPILLLLVVIVIGALISLGRATRSFTVPTMVLFAFGVVGFFVFMLTTRIVRDDSSVSDLGSGELHSRIRGVDTSERATALDFRNPNEPSLPHAIELDAPAERAAAHPEWIEDAGQAPQKIGDVYRMVLLAGPHQRLSDCYRDLDSALIKATKTYIDTTIPGGNSRQVNLAAGGLRDEMKIVHDEYIVKRSHTFGAMNYLYVQLQFDSNDDKRLRRLMQEAVVHRRLGYAGFGLTSILLLLLTTVAYLRIDTATEGQWAGRLKLAAAGVILAVLTSGALLFGLVNLI